MLWAVLLGTVAGGVDVMHVLLLRGVAWRDAAVPLFHWVVTAAMIASVPWPPNPTLRGALAVLLLALPTLVRYPAAGDGGRAWGAARPNWRSPGC